MPSSCTRASSCSARPTRSSLYPTISPDVSRARHWPLTRPSPVLVAGGRWEILGSESTSSTRRACLPWVWPPSNPAAYRIGGLSHRHVGRVRDAVTGQFAPDGSLASELEAAGLLRNKHVPEIYLRASVEQRLALLQGLMDSDGYVDDYGR